MNTNIHAISIQTAPCSVWQGGKTYELAIGSEGSSYAGRDFLFRISTAMVDLDHSTFTSLPDYMRIIMPIDGALTLVHNDGPEVHLPPLSAHSFDGGWRTESHGRAQDFNLMMRKGQCRGDMEAPQLQKGVPLEIPAQKSSCRLFYCVDGSCSIIFGSESHPFQPGEGLCTGGEACILCADRPATVICTCAEPI